MGMPNWGGQIPPPPLPPQAKGNATTALVLGILGIVCCPLVGPIAWYLGSKELTAIRAGASPMSGESSARAGMILGIIGSIWIGVLLIIWILGGMAFLTGILQSARSY